MPVPFVSHGHPLFSERNPFPSHSLALAVWPQGPAHPLQVEKERLAPLLNVRFSRSVVCVCVFRDSFHGDIHNSSQSSMNSFIVSEHNNVCAANGGFKKLQRQVNSK